MFGRLNIDALHAVIHEPIVRMTILGVILLGLIIVALITKAGKWQYLWKEWLTSVDHKKIGVMYIITALVMLVRGFVDAMLMRTQQMLASSGAEGFLPPEHYDQIFTVHGVLMIFFVAMPLVIGLMNIVVPLQIGARDVAFPYLNSLSFWLFIGGVVLTNLSLGVGEYARTGWLAYPPLSGIKASPGVGVDYWIWALQIAGVGSTLTGVNFFATIMKMRTPSMPLMKMPIFTWTELCTNILMVIVMPVLTIAIALLSLDRYLGMHFFTNDLGGNMMMYINLIWIFGHPEVYILILPVFGVYSEITATFSRKRLFGYTSLVWATMVIAILSFVVWLHHFFTMGSGANVNAFFGIATMIIAIPTGVKIFNWLFTMWQGRIQFTTPMLWTVGFLMTFAIGGMTGVLLAVPGADFVLHGTVFLVAHFHNVIIGGVVFGCFAAITYWFPKVTGFTLNERWGKVAFFFWLNGFLLAFMPLYALGFDGMPRRLGQNIDGDFNLLLTVSAIGSYLIFVGLVCQIIQFYVSFRDREQNKDLTGDPWDARTFEWATTSPPQFYNFAHLPQGDEIDAFWYQKQRGEYDPMTEGNYERIHMPKNTATGIFVSAWATIFGFAMIWYIWWLAAIGFLGIIITSIKHSYNDDLDYYVEVDDIQAIEDERRAQWAQAQSTQEATHAS